MRKRRSAAWCGRMAIVAAGCLAAPAPADILVVSQNTLHLGQGSASVADYIAGKNAFVRALADWPGRNVAQLTFLQEVMSQAREDDVVPSGATILFGELKGLSRYKERYGAILAGAGGQAAILCHVDTAGLVSVGFRMERPPDAYLVGDTDTDGTHRLAWYFNFHAVFGRNAAVRRAEAAEMGHIMTRLRLRTPEGCPETSANMVALGDWNLPATDRAFADLARNAGFDRPQVAPNALTSLNREGRRSSAYDHFVWDDARVEVVPANTDSQPMCGTQAAFVAGVLTPIDTASFRRRRSDHLGVAALVRIR